MGRRTEFELGPTFRDGRRNCQQLDAKGVSDEQAEREFTEHKKRRRR